MMSRKKGNPAKGVFNAWKKWPLAGKIASIVIALVLVGGIAGAGGGTQEQPEEQPAQQEQVASVEPAHVQKDSVELSQNEKPSGSLSVHFIDVGQGDSEFVELPTGETMLIDAGESSEAQTVVEYVKSLGYSSIDYVVATHPHSDHIGGMPQVFSSFEVGEVWAPAVTHDTQTFESFLDAVDAEGLSINTATAGKQITTGNGMAVDILSPTEGASYDDLNDWSAIVELTFGDESFLFCGDAGTDVISSSDAGDIDVLKVGHHGSDTSTNTSLVSSLAPEYAVISCGAGNSYGHPHQAALDALSAVTVYRTDVDGTVVAKSDGHTVEWQTRATEPRVTASAAQQSEAEASIAAAPEKEPAQEFVEESQPAANSNSGITVYITRTGEKYHLDGCSSLSKSKIPVSLEEAKARGYEPCKRCNPPA